MPKATTQLAAKTAMIDDTSIVLQFAECSKKLPGRWKPPFQSSMDPVDRMQFMKTINRKIEKNMVTRKLNIYFKSGSDPWKQECQSFFVNALSGRQFVSEACILFGKEWSNQGKCQIEQDGDKFDLDLTKPLGDQIVLKEVNPVANVYIEGEGFKESVFTELISNLEILSLGALAMEDEDIARGTYGFIRKGKLNGKDIAAKYITRWDPNGRIADRVRKEVEILSKFHHPCVITFSGFVPPTKETLPTIVFPYMPNLSVDCWLGKNRDRYNFQALDFTHKYIILYGTAEGMKYLHAGSVIHRDMKPSNILLDVNMYPKITDFGLSKIMEDGASPQQSVSEGTRAYTAPEMMSQTDYTNSVDVYAFAVTMYYILTEIVPASEASAWMQMQSIMNGTRPKIPDTVHPLLADLMERCWDSAPEQRLTFEEIVDILRDEKVRSELGVESEPFEEYCRTIHGDDVSMSISDKIDVRIIPKIKNHFLEAAEKGDPEDMCTYALQVKHNGCGVADEQRTAVVENYLKKAVEAKCAKAMVELGNCYLEEYLYNEHGKRCAAELYRDAMNLKSIDGMYKYAECLFVGTGIMKNQDEAIMMFKYCADNGNPFAQMRYAQCLEEGKSTEFCDLKRKRTAIKYYEMASKNGLTEATYKIGMLHLNSNNIDEAIPVFELAASQGYHAANLELCKIFLYDKKDFNRALYYADRGAMNNVFGCMVEYGLIQGCNGTKANAYIEKAKGDVMSYVPDQWNYAKQCENGVNMPKDIKKAMTIYKWMHAVNVSQEGDKALYQAIQLARHQAKLGIARCSLMMGENVDNALNVLNETSDPDTVAFYGRALAAGDYGLTMNRDAAITILLKSVNPRVRFELGYIYEMISEPALAAHAYGIAAKGGHAEAMYRLAMIYEEGRTSNRKKNIDDVRKLYEGATMRGHKEAAERLKNFK